jgi:uncharacterized protein YPO0396
MKHLKKMLLTNWHYFNHEVITFDRINFLTGQNASGKSTLIDAIQILLLGETRSSIFNKAANEKSERTLQGYLKGELGDDGSTGFRYLREKDFSSHLAMEFYDDVKNTSFVIGCVFDVYREGDPKYNYFIADGKLPENYFLQKNIPFNRHDMRTYLKKHHSKRLTWCDTNRQYQQVLTSRFGSIKKNKFFSLIKKSVPFSPITDIESFITEYMTDVSNNIDISYMQDNLRNYKRLEKDAKGIIERLDHLDKINQKHTQILRFNETINLHDFLIHQGELEQANENIKRLKSDVIKLSDDVTHLENEREELSKNEEKIAGEITELEIELRNSDLAQKIESLHQKIDETQETINRLENNLVELLAEIKTIATQVSNGLSKYNGKKLDIQKRVHIEKDFERIEKLKFEQYEIIEKDFMMELSKRFIEYVEAAKEIKYSISNQQEQLKDELEDKRKKISGLKAGIKPYRKEILDLKDKLSEVVDEPPRILSDVIEIKGDRWKNAIEGYLHTQKFYLLVEPEDFQRALRLYDDFKQQRNLHGIGLVDIHKVMNKNFQVQMGSLAEEINTEDRYARIYIDFLLGNVMKCDHVDELRKHRTAITDSGMLYQNYVARQLNPKRWAQPFIGHQSIAKQIEKLTEEIETSEITYKVLLSEHKEIDTITKLHFFTEREITEMRKQIQPVKDIPEYKLQLSQSKKELNSLDMTYITTLQDRIKSNVTQKNDLRKKIDNSIELVGGLKNKKESILNKDLPHIQSIKAQEERYIADHFVCKWVEEMGIPRFEKESLEKSYPQIINSYGSARQGQISRKESALKELYDLRRSYNRDFHMSHPVESEDNSAYLDIFETLMENKLPDYMEKIREAKEMASQQFKDEFLSKLKENFDTVIRQLKELNEAIKTSSFGNDKYEFVVKVLPQFKHFYDMIMDPLLLTEGISILSDAFTSKHGDTVNQLFDMITEVEDATSADERVALEKNIKVFTDYRSYLNFDLNVMGKDGTVQRLSKTLLKKSGGETQTPFYISILASFAQMYRINQKGQHANTVRLIIFDEAFSKMDSQRIKESLILLERFELQAIVSAPPDKIPDITPFVNNNLFVFRNSHYSFVKNFSKKDMEGIS